jgi:nitrogen fixation protein NifU and related proteins
MHEELYKQHILDHYARPRNRGVLTDATHTAEGSNPSCGDRLTIYLQIEEGTIRTVSFEGEGCAISQAATSLLTERVKHCSVTDAQTLGEQDMYALLGVEITSARRACALLGYTALHAALTDYAHA